jgi:hypothetical protein
MLLYYLLNQEKFHREDEWYTEILLTTQTIDNQHSTRKQNAQKRIKSLINQIKSEVRPLPFYTTSTEIPIFSLPKFVVREKSNHPTALEIH